MRKIRLVIEYAGQAYHGWQVQPDCPTVQGCLERALENLTGSRPTLNGASRTDAGVHALGQVAHFETENRLSTAAIPRALNHWLPRDIRVLRADEVAPDFDARRWALAKRYAYVILNRPIEAVFWRGRAWWVPGDLDISAMGQALVHLRGKHDFSAFCASAGRDRDPVCQILSTRVRARRGLIGVFLSADSFLHHMVRNIVGSLVEIGRGRHPAAWMAELLLGLDRRQAGPTVPPDGLYLLRVLYPREPLRNARFSLDKPDPPR